METSIISSHSGLKCPPNKPGFLWAAAPIGSHSDPSFTLAVVPENNPCFLPSCAQVFPPFLPRLTHGVCEREPEETRNEPCLNWWSRSNLKTRTHLGTFRPMFPATPSHAKWAPVSSEGLTEEGLRSLTQSQVCRRVLRDISSSCVSRFRC